MADEVNTVHCPLDELFTRNVPHILENIFFSLDYESFKTCMEVNKGWHELLTSRFYNKKALLLFHKGRGRAGMHHKEAIRDEERRVLGLGDFRLARRAFEPHLRTTAARCV